MSPLFLTIYVVQWIVIACLAVMVLLLYRQFGLMIMPNAQRLNMEGLDVGKRAPALALRFGDQREAVFDWQLQADTLQAFDATCVLFALPSCPLCAELSRNTVGMSDLAARNPAVRFVWVDAGDKSAHELPPPWTVARSSNSAAHDAMEVPSSPFIYLVSTSGRVLTKGLVNEPTDIEALIAQATVTPDDAQLVTEHSH